MSVRDPKCLTVDCDAPQGEVYQFCTVCQPEWEEATEHGATFEEFVGRKRLARVTAERDEAVAALQKLHAAQPGHPSYPGAIDAAREAAHAVLAKHGKTP